MASPFRVFRKHQKTLLVVAGVILMFVFVLGDSLMGLIGRTAGGGGNPSDSPRAVAVSWDGGELTNAELRMLVYKRMLVNHFVQQVEALGQQRTFDAGADLRPLRVGRVVGPDQPSEGVERSVVRMKLFADAARAAGMRLSDDQVVHYLEELGRGRVSGDDMRYLLSQINVQNRTAPITLVLDALREELLAQNYLAGYQFALETVLPEDRWRDWCRVNDRIVVEAAAIPVETFLIDVPEPTEEEVVAFFERYKERVPRPDRVVGTELPSPWPGFAVPRKIDVQYVQANFDQFVDKLEDQITEDQIKEYYEENKDLYFVRADSGLTDDTEDQEANEEQTDAGTQEADAAQTDDTKAASAEPAGDAEQASSAGDTSDADTEPEVETQGTDDPNDTAVDEESPDEPPAPAKNYQPLEEVRDQIRRQLAELQVSDELAELIAKVERELHTAYIEYFNQVLEAEVAEKPLPEPPPELADLSALTEKYGLEAGRTGPESSLELRDTPVGMSVKADENNLPLWYVLFGQERELYQPLATFDLDGNRYVAMKASDTPGKVPTLDEVRDEVVQAWKMEQAADLALKHAEAEAERAQKSGAWLGDFFANDDNVQVVRTDPFAWLTIGNVSPRTGQVESFRLSQPDGIVAAGPQFMNVAFDLQGGEVAAALNHDRSIAYVLRLVEHQSSLEEMRRVFLSEADQWYGLARMTQDHVGIAYNDLVMDLLSSIDLRWERQPDQVVQE